MKKLLIMFWAFLAGCAAQPVAEPPREKAQGQSAPQNHKARLQGEADAGEREAIGALLAAAELGDEHQARALLTEYALAEIEALHEGLGPWLKLLASGRMSLTELYTREGAGGRFQVARWERDGGSLELGFFLLREGGRLKLDNLLCTGPVAPGISPALASSRSNVLRAFWAYYGALLALAPESLPGEAAQAPAVSQRVRLSLWRTSTLPELRRAMQAAGPASTRENTTAYLDAACRVLGGFNLPEVREADLKEGRLVVLFTPAPEQSDAGALPFLIEYRSRWWHGMQVLCSEQRVQSTP